MANFAYKPWRVLFYFVEAVFFEVFAFSISTASWLAASQCVKPGCIALPGIVVVCVGLESIAAKFRGKNAHALHTRGVRVRYEKVLWTRRNKHDTSAFAMRVSAL